MARDTKTKVKNKSPKTSEAKFSNARLTEDKPKKNGNADFDPIEFTLDNSSLFVTKMSHAGSSYIFTYGSRTQDIIMRKGPDSRDKWGKVSLNEVDPQALVEIQRNLVSIHKSLRDHLGSID